MKRIGATYLFFLMLCTNFLFAQHDKEFKQQLKEADELFSMDDFKNAENKYMPLWKQDTANEHINLNIAICKYKLHELPDSIMPFLLRVDRSKDPEAQYYEARMYHLTHKFDDAIAHYEKYMKFPEKDRSTTNKEVERLIEMSKRATEMMAEPHKASIKNIGGAINTKYPEYTPLITLDESTMYFTSRRPGSTGGLTDAWGNYYEDIYESSNKDGVWSEPKNIGPPINTATHDACVGLSADAQKLIIFRTSEDQLSGDLYVSHAAINNWSEPEKLGSEINSEYKELSACLSGDNNTIYFSSDRPGGLGGKDLYRVVRFMNGKWSLPYNLGPTINTPYDEDAPFLHIDGTTLYFSSNGHATMGGYDVFKTSIGEYNKLTPPEDIGFPINTVGDDIFFVLSADGKHGYYSSLNENPADPGYESEDIYFIDMRYSENDIKVRKGSTVSKESNGSESAIIAKITIIDTQSNRVAGIYNTNAVTGNFIFIVNPYDTYKMVTEAKGYETVVTDLSPLVNDKNEDAPELKIVLKKL